MTIDISEKLDFNNVLIVPKRSTLESRSQVILEKEFVPKYGKPFSGVGIVASNMATGTFKMLEVFSKHKMFVAIAKHNNSEWQSNITQENLDYGFYTIGMSETELKELRDFSLLAYSKGFQIDNIKICIDIANGYTQKFASFVNKVRTTFPFNVIVAGNVATPEMVQELVISGADYVKIGVGPGAFCTTRKMTGVGYSQISAAILCSDAAHGLGAGIILDGGMRYPGDIAKAFCSNSDMVMIGGMLSGTDECDGEIITRYFQSDELEWNPEAGMYIRKTIEKKYKLFYGMSSDYSQEKHFGGVKEYRASEGTVEEVEYKGPVDSIVKDILGGLRSTATYIGAKSLKDFGKCATLIKVPYVHAKF